MVIRKKVDGIEFGILSPKQIRNMSAAKIYTPNTYDDDGYPIEGGLMDPRLGIIDPGISCKTCGGRVGECKGHFGYAELTRPVVNVGYIQEIYNLLVSTCKGCGKLILSDEMLKEYVDKGFKPFQISKVWEKSSANSSRVYAKQEECPYCGEKKPIMKFVKPYSFYEIVDGVDNKLLVSEIREWFEKIPDEDIKKLGMTIRPEWLILKVIPVLPITARPSITLESSDRSEDDLTHKLVDILRISQRLEENINSGAPQLVIEDLWDLLQYHVATYFNNELPGVPPARHRSGRPLKTIIQRLKAKEGRFRNNLSGKRVNFSARTVVGPDPNLSINELGVPEVVAKELTISEEVNDVNIKVLKKAILNGPDKHPGALNVIHPDGKRKRILDLTKEAIAKALNIGDLVERHITDGDVVIFNRQPSLHRISMMAHRVKVLPYKTFRINTAVCAPYNADFDGDEMNLHVPQSEEARAEAEVLMKVQECIISPRFGEAIIGGKQDYVTGMTFFTIKKYLFSWDDVPGDDNKRLKDYLVGDLGIGWAENAKIKKSSDEKTITVTNKKNSLKLKLIGNTKVILKTSTGESYELILKEQEEKDKEGGSKKKSKKKIYKEPEILSRDDALELAGGLVKLRKGKDEFTTKELFSLLLPSDLDIEYKGKLCECKGECEKKKCPTEGYVIIKKGKLKYGAVDVESMGNELLNIIFTKYGSDAAREFIDNSTRLALRTIAKMGVTVGIDDYDIPEIGRKKIKEKVELAISNVDEYNRLFKEKKLKMLPGKKSLEDTKETYIMNCVSEARNESGDVCAEYLEGKSPVIMAKSGSRGSMFNVTQISGLMGQQLVGRDYTRAKTGYFKRTLSHFEKGDMGADARGFVKSNFKDGMTPTEYFFHTRNGRLTLIEIALNISGTGYLQRNILNAFNDLMVYSDRSVRDFGGLIIQFVYGDDGIHPMKRRYVEKRGA